MGIENAYFTPGPEGRLIIGNDVIKLEDESKKEFHTDNLLAFEGFCTGREGDAEIYYSDKEVTLVPTKAATNFKILAKCTLLESAPLALLSKNQGRDLSIVEFEKLLTALRRYAVGSHLAVLSNLRSFVVAKKQTYARDVDNHGNFKLLIQREDAGGSNNWTPPEKMAFNVPVFAFLQEVFAPEFDFVFSLNEAGQPIFRLENLTFGQELLDRKVAILEERLGKVATCPKYWGSYVHHALNDGWRYRENKASL